MSPFVLTVLKVVFLVLLYFFIWRAIRSVMIDMRGVRTVAGPVPRATARPEIAGRPSKKAPRAVVVIDDKGTKATHRLVDGQLQIGRADACQIKLADTYVSQFHARLFRRDGGWFVEDLGSTNG